MRKSVSALLVFLVVLPCMVGTAFEARAEAESTWGFQLSRDLMSPYCPGRTLADCPSTKADELRAWIYEQEEAGRDREEVKAELVGRFGEKMLGAPPAKGFAWAAYLIPFLLFVLGGAVVTFFLRRQGSEVAPENASMQAVDPDVARLIDEEMRE